MHPRICAGSIRWLVGSDEWSATTPHPERATELPVINTSAINRLFSYKHAGDGSLVADYGCDQHQRLHWYVIEW